MDAYILQVSDILAASESWYTAAASMIFKYGTYRVFVDITREHPPVIRIYAKKHGEHGIALTPAQLPVGLTLSSDVIKYGQRMIRARKHQRR